MLNFALALSTLFFTRPEVTSCGELNGTSSGECVSFCMCGIEDYGTGQQTRTMRCENLSFNNTMQLLETPLPKIHKLTIRNSKLSVILGVNGLRDLCELDLSYNRIKTALIYDSFEVYDQLEYLNLQHNEFWILRREEFISFPKLAILDLSYNQISEINEQTFRLLQLKNLYLHHNNIKYIGERMFRFSPLLHTLDLASNQLKEVHSRNFYYLRNLKILNISRNGIYLLEKDSFLPLYELEEVNLSYNRLCEINSEAFAYLFRLKTLTLDGNPISLIRPGDVAALTVREISLCDMPNLTMVLDNSFQHLDNLTLLRMEQNKKLCYISPGSFSGAPRLQELALRENKLIHIPYVFAKNSIQRVRLSGNPFKCGCEWPKDSVKKLVDADNLTCQDGKTRRKFVSVTGANCRPKLCTYGDDQTINARVGGSERLYCVADSPANITWSFPGGQKFRYTIRPEFLEITDLQKGDSGLYKCSLHAGGSIVDSQRFYLKVAEPDVFIYPVYVGDHYIVIQWNHSAAFTDIQNFELTYKRTDSNDVEETITLDALFYTRRLYALKAHTNYTLCVLYKPHGVTLYDFCTEVTTLKSYRTTLGITLDYPMIATISGVTSIIVAVCIARCVYRRFHVWQREKWHSRMQESLSAQGFFSSFDSLSSSTVAVTYENMHLDENNSEISEETSAFLNRRNDDPTRLSCCSSRSVISTIDRSLDCREGIINDSTV